MTNSQLHPKGWISVFVHKRHEDWAKQMRAKRDLQYGNIYAEAKTDERWVGDLGEKVFNSWLKHEGVNDCKWILKNTSGEPDFITADGIRIGVKTVKRKVPPQISYTAQITACHTEEPVDYFFFLSYEFVDHRMWLLGGIDRESFLDGSRHYAAGEWVHPKYQIRPGHEINNIELSKLTPPKQWLAAVKKRSTQ